MTASQWCLGWPPARGPHVPSDGALIEVRSPRSFLLCADCWRLFQRDDNGGDR